MSNPLHPQRNKKMIMTFSFVLFVIVAGLSQWYHFQFVYGTTFSFASLFLLLGLRLFGYLPGLLTAAVLIPTGIWLLEQPAFYYIFLIEAAVVGLLIQKFKNHLFGSDAVFWLFIGTPLLFWFHQTNAPMDAKDMLLIARIAAINGLFNALFAEIIYQYVPLHRWSGISTVRRRPKSFTRVLFHFSFSIVFVSFLLNTLTNSLSSFKEISLYAQRLSANEVTRLTDIWNLWSAQSGIPSQQEEIAFFQRLLNREASGLNMTVTNKSSLIVASRTPDEIGRTFDPTRNSKVTPINEKIYLTVPHEPSNLLYFHSWHNGSFIYNNKVPTSEWMIHVEVPVNTYKNYLLTKYFTHFVYLAGFAAFAMMLAYLINRWLVRSLKRLAATTTNLPTKLKQMNTVEWPKSSIVEIQSLISNFKQMSTDLVHLFDESQKNNERLQAQAYMLQQSEEQLHRLAYFDMLTGLPNRLHFTRHVQDLTTLKAGTNQPIAIMFADINRFKQVNDTLGHSVGDALLQQTAERFEAAAAADFTVFRLGGDEFVFVGHFDNEAGLQASAQAVVDSFIPPFDKDELSLFLTVSVGISVYPYDSEDIDTIIRNADMAMYSAKEQGDGCYRFFNPSLVTTMTEKMQLENGLYNALQTDQFSLHYQPKINASTGDICGIEALIRWQHPKLGMIPPDKFIPLAEQSGLILEIDSWVFHEACRQNKEWQSAGLAPICVSVNISARHFYQGNLINMIEKTLRETGLAPQYVSLEITEGVLMRNMEQVIDTIRYLRKLGIHISIDDFGTGYSSLNQLQRLPISDVKLDRSFIQGITKDSKKSSIVKAIIELVHSMNMRVIAEGVETLDEAKFCRELKCDELQGYLFSKPLPPQQLELLLKKTG
ncbi:EAL domain-containing protein [Paenibacillus sp. sgz302251]|uniref:EAL domain-containing protein n=1 Tax=Paenibacillus sp. sgz302251 TaxID=3414493 RepID=UPI003C7C3FEF